MLVDVLRHRLGRGEPLHCLPLSGNAGLGHGERSVSKACEGARRNLPFRTTTPRGDRNKRASSPGSMRISAFAGLLIRRSSGPIPHKSSPLPRLRLWKYCEEGERCVTVSAPPWRREGCCRREGSAAAAAAPSAELIAPQQRRNFASAGLRPSRQQWGDQRRRLGDWRQWKPRRSPGGWRCVRVTDSAPLGGEVSAEGRKVAVRVLQPRHPLQTSGISDFTTLARLGEILKYLLLACAPSARVQGTRR